MTSLSEQVALEVNGEQVNLADALLHAKLAGRLQFLQAAFDAALIRQAAPGSSVHDARENRLVQPTWG